MDNELLYDLGFNVYQEGLYRRLKSVREFNISGYLINTRLKNIPGTTIPRINPSYRNLSRVAVEARVSEDLYSRENISSFLDSKDFHSFTVDTKYQNEQIAINRAILVEFNCDYSELNTAENYNSIKHDILLVLKKL